MKTQIIQSLSEIWQQTTGSQRVCIAIIDGAADLSHEALKDSHIKHIDASGLPMDNPQASEHGTHIASILFGNHNSKIKGLCPNAKGVVIPVFGLKKSSTQLDLSRAINAAMEYGANIINISAGELSDSGEPDIHLKNILEKCEAQNVLVVAAAGNDGCNCVHVPASVPTVLTVGGLDDDNRPLPMSNFSKKYKRSGILAPAEKIFGAGLNNTYIKRSGTSFATPFVAGIAALLMSKDPSLTPLDARKLILESALPCPSNSSETCVKYLTGILNIRALSNYFTKELTLSKKTTITPEFSKTKLYNFKKLYTMEHNQINLNESVATIAQENLQHSTVSLSGLNEVQPISIDDQIETETYESVSHQEMPITASSEIGIKPSCGGDSECGCGDSKKVTNGPAQMQKVYALGTIGYDFVNPSRRDSFLQHVNENINDPSVILKHLESGHLTEASELIWTLNQEGTPIYAIHPHGPFARDMYQLIIDFMKGQLNDNGVERVSIPGIVAGNVTLMNGQVVPAIAPTIRGMASWSTKALVASLGKGTSRDALNNFLERVYHEFRNFGSSSQDRAINFAATNAFQANSVFQTAIKDGMQLTDIEVVRSPIVRPGVDGWDVQLSFFDPKNRFEKAKKMYKYTVDVSDIVPVTIGSVRSWWVY